MMKCHAMKISIHSGTFHAHHLAEVISRLGRVGYDGYADNVGDGLYGSALPTHLEPLLRTMSFYGSHVATAVLRADCPGAMSYNIENFDFRRVPRPIFPLNREMEWWPYATGDRA